MLHWCFPILKNADIEWTIARLLFPPKILQHHCLQISLCWSMFKQYESFHGKMTQTNSKMISSKDAKQSSWLRLYDDLSFYENPFERYNDDCNRRYHTWFVYYTYCQTLYLSVYIFTVTTPNNLRCSWSFCLQ